MKNAPRLLQYLTCIIYLCSVGNVLAQDSQHDHQVDSVESAATAALDTVDHSAHTAASATQSAPMEHSVHTKVETSGLRDPHAYSNGYTRTTGPYVFTEGPHTHMADEMTFTGVWIDRLEQVRLDGADATELEGYAWRGNSYDKFLFNIEAEIVNNALEHAEVDLLWSHAVRPFWNLQMGVQQEFGDGPNRSWVTIGLKGLAPYWFEVESNIYVGENGRTAIDLEAEYDLLLTQRLILQPRLDFKAYGKSDAKAGRGKGLSSMNSGLRLRYEFSRQFAPYIGVERAAVFGKTAELLPVGEDEKETHWIVGLRFWF